MEEPWIEILSALGGALIVFNGGIGYFFGKNRKIDDWWAFVIGALGGIIGWIIIISIQKVNITDSNDVTKEKISTQMNNNKPQSTNQPQSTEPIEKKPQVLTNPTTNPSNPNQQVIVQQKDGCADQLVKGCGIVALTIVILIVFGVFKLSSFLDFLF